MSSNEIVVCEVDGSAHQAGVLTCPVCGNKLPELVEVEISTDPADE